MSTAADTAPNLSSGRIVPIILGSPEPDMITEIAPGSNVLVAGIAGGELHSL
jgi:hypothetical protein